MLEGQNIVVYDTEIKMPVNKNPYDWKDHDKLGISVACLYDYEDGDYKVYTDGEYHLLARRLNRARYVVGFNIVGFDNLLLRGAGLDLLSDACWDGSWTGDTERLNNLDLLYLARQACGWDGKSDCFYKGLRLDDILEATYGRSAMKLANGAEAPYMWQRGEWGKLITYCLSDVKRERRVFEDAVRGLEFKSPQHKPFKLAIPRDLLDRLGDVQV